MKPPLWQKLKTRADYYKNNFNLHEAFLSHPGRADALSLKAPFVFADLSRNLWDRDVVDQAVMLAEKDGFDDKRRLLLEGGNINYSESCPALHIMLRDFDGVYKEKPDADIYQGLDAMLVLAEKIRANPDIKDIVHIGIGGSLLGPKLVLQALKQYQSQKNIHFISAMNDVTAKELLSRLDVKKTVFIAVSKSFQTVEILRNIKVLRAEIHKSGGRIDKNNWVAVTTHTELAKKNDFQTILTIPKEIGGRFSLWSAAGLVIAIALGVEHFRALLKGASMMDRHFASAPLKENLPLWLGFLDVWNRSLLDLSGHCVLDYSSYLGELPNYLQQLMMESNGKSVDYRGKEVTEKTAPIIWGSDGIEGQHSFFQWLHQAKRESSCEFIVIAGNQDSLDTHRFLHANALAHAYLLTHGHQAEGNAHRFLSGNRPSNFIILDAMTPMALGAFLALQEHRIFVAGTFWGINSFDQWGVEEGKKCTKIFEKNLMSGDIKGLDSSMVKLLSLLNSTS